MSHWQKEVLGLSCKFNKKFDLFMISKKLRIKINFDLACISFLCVVWWVGGVECVGARPWRHVAETNMIHKMTTSSYQKRKTVVSRAPKFRSVRDGQPLTNCLQKSQYLDLDRFSQPQWELLTIWCQSYSRALDSLLVGGGNYCARRNKSNFFFYPGWI